MGASHTRSSEPPHAQGPFANGPVLCAPCHMTSGGLSAPPSFMHPSLLVLMELQGSLETTWSSHSWPSLNNVKYLCRKTQGFKLYKNVLTNVICTKVVLRLEDFRDRCGVPYKAAGTSQLTGVLVLILNWVAPYRFGNFYTQSESHKRNNGTPCSPTGTAENGTEDSARL